MAALTTDLLFILAPEFTSDTRAAVVLGLSEQAHTSSKWGTVYAQAMAYHAAHTLTMLGPLVPVGTPPGGGTGVTSGPVTSRRAGDLAETYGDAATNVSRARPGSVDTADYAQTPYGRRYLALRSSLASLAPCLVEPTDGV